MNPNYTLTKKRLIVHLILLICTAGSWLLFALIIEFYLMFKK